MRDEYTSPQLEHDHKVDEARTAGIHHSDRDARRFGLRATFDGNTWIEDHAYTFGLDLVGA